MRKSLVHGWMADCVRGFRLSLYSALSYWCIYLLACKWHLRFSEIWLDLALTFLRKQRRIEGFPYTERLSLELETKWVSWICQASLTSRVCLWSLKLSAAVGYFFNYIFYTWPGAIKLHPLLHSWLQTRNIKFHGLKHHPQNQQSVFLKEGAVFRI